MHPKYRLRLHDARVKEQKGGEGEDVAGLHQNAIFIKLVGVS